MMKDKQLSHRVCPDCGAQLTIGFRFCGQCGAPIEPETAMQSQDAPHPEISSRMQPAKEITWEKEISLLNRFIIRDYLLVLAVIPIVMQVIFLVMSIALGEKPAFLPAQLWLITGFIFIALFLIAILVVLRNRFSIHFTINPEGAFYEAGSREKKINRWLLLLSMFSGKPVNIGSSLISYSQESGGFDWKDIYSVTVHQSSNVITLNSSWRPVLRLYCQPEIFDRVVENVQSYASRGAEWRASHNIHPPPYGFYLKWASMTAIAFIASLMWLSGYDVWRTNFWPFYWKADDIALPALIISFLVLLAGMFEGKKRRILALFATIGSLLFLYSLTTLVLGQYTDIEKTYSFYGYEVDPALFSISFIGGLALAAMSLLALLGWKDSSIT
ncbi:MAG: zinc ribbon domain-containing protein [Candidatus Methanoperedens sp.]